MDQLEVITPSRVLKEIAFRAERERWRTWARGRLASAPE